ncbi:unnamed protein product, partial [Brassica rapa]
MNSQSNLPAFSASFVGGRMRPRRLFGDLFSSSVPSWGEVPEANNEAVPMASLRQNQEEIFNFSINGGSNEVAVFEAYMEAGFRGSIPSLIDEVSSYFGFSPSQLTLLTWRTLIAIQVLGEFYGISFGVHDVLYFYYFAPLASKQ